MSPQPAKIKSHNLKEMQIIFLSYFQISARFVSRFVFVPLIFTFF